MEHPVKESFYFPASAIAAQFVSILAFAPVLPVRSNQFDAIFLGELLVERVGVIDVVANEPGWELVEKTSGKNLFLAKRSASRLVAPI